MIVITGIDESWTPSLIDQEDFASEPDPSLEDGQELGQYYETFPNEFYKCILEDLDVYYKQRGLQVLHRLIKMVVFIQYSS